jgi:hypothetical protein
VAKDRLPEFSDRRGAKGKIIAGINNVEKRGIPLVASRSLVRESGERVLVK